jgi:hypothetical protein
MLSSFAPWCAETCISASAGESQKLHQGFAGQNPILHRGVEWSKSTNALGLPEWAGKTASGPAVAANNDAPLNPDAQKIFSQVYRQAAPIGNPCFWGAWAVGATAVGAGGAAAANGTEIATTAAENYPTWFTRAVNWLFGKASNPGPVGAMGAGVRAAWTQVNSTCSQLQ